MIDLIVFLHAVLFLKSRHFEEPLSDFLWVIAASPQNLDTGNISETRDAHYHLILLAFVNVLISVNFIIYSLCVVPGVCSSVVLKSAIFGGGGEQGGEEKTKCFDYIVFSL